MPTPAPPDLTEDPAEIAADRDAYAAEVQALIRQAAAGHAREAFLNDTIAQLRTALAAVERRADRYADALTRAGLPLPAREQNPLALAA